MTVEWLLGKFVKDREATADYLIHRMMEIREFSLFWDEMTYLGRSDFKSKLESALLTMTRNPRVVEDYNSPL